jgi:hypothetical protein
LQRAANQGVPRQGRECNQEEHQLTSLAMKKLESAEQLELVLQ